MSTCVACIATISVVLGLQFTRVCIAAVVLLTAFSATPVYTVSAHALLRMLERKAVLALHQNCRRSRAIHAYRSLPWQTSQAASADQSACLLAMFAHRYYCVGLEFGSFKCSTSDNTLQFHVLSSDVLLSTPLLDHLSSINCSSSILHTHVDCLSQGTLVWSSQFRAYLLPTRLSESKLVCA